MAEKKVTGTDPLEGKQTVQNDANNGAITSGDPTTMVGATDTSGINSEANPSGNINVSADGTSSPSTVDTNVTTDVNTNLGKAIEEGIDENKKLEETIDTNFESGKTDIATDKTTDTTVATDFYNQNEELIKKADEDLAKIEEEQLKLSEERKGRDVALLEGKKQSEIDMLEASNALQRTKNEQALKDAKTQAEMEKYKSAWAYNKLGLGFSSGIINQSQQIATQGIAKIAEIKAQMAFNEASIDAQIAGLEFDYSSLVNETIDKYADRTNEIKESMRARINDTKKSLLLNSFDKNKELTTIEREARDALKDAERTHIEDIIKVKDRGIQMEEMLQSEISRYKNEELKKMDTMLSNGTFAKLTPEQIAQKEAELGLPAGSLTSEFANSIGADIRGTFDSILGADYMVDNMPTLVQDMKNEMKMGRTYEEAFNIIMSRELKDNKIYQNKKARDEKLKDIELLKAQKSLSSGSGTSGGGDYGEYIASYGEGSNALTEKEWNTLTPEQKEVKVNTINISKGDNNSFLSVYNTELNNIKTAVKDGKKSDTNSNIKTIIMELKGIGVQDDIIIGHLEKSGVINGSNIKLKDGEIINTKGKNSTIYNFNKTK